MIVSLRHRLALLAMPKTGTTAVEAVLAPRCDLVFGGDPRVKHMTARKYHRFVAPLLASWTRERIETACLVREPIDWLASWYRYRRREGLRARDRRTDGIGFPAFVEAYLAEDPPEFARVGRPADFLRGRDGQPAVDHLFRYENFAGFRAFLEARFGGPLAFPALNVSPPADTALPAPLRARAEAALAEDYAIWRDLAR